MSQIPYNKETEDRFVDAEARLTAIEATSVGSALTSAHIIVGNSSNVAADVAMSGDIAITNAGVTSIASGVIVNADVKSDAAIALSKIHLLDETKTDGTILSSIKLVPTASTATGSIAYHKLVAIGDVTGNTAFGMGDVTKPTTGVMGCFGRTAIATSAFTGYDSGADFRMINKLANDAAYSMQGAYIKCKNYSGATVGAMRGLFVEAVGDGTESSVIGIKVGSDGTALDHAIDLDDCVVTNGADIKLSSGITIGSGSAAPTHVAAPGSLYIRTGQSDQKAMLYLCTVADGTWVLLNTVTA